MPTLFEKIWARHVVTAREDDVLLYIDRHLVHEVTSPQAFAGLSAAGRSVPPPGAMLAVPDHNVPTTPDRSVRIEDRGSRNRSRRCGKTPSARGSPCSTSTTRGRGSSTSSAPSRGSSSQGISVVCGDSHTGTLGAFGSIAFGIGTSEVEHVLATQALWQKMPLQMRVVVTGTLRPFVTPKDVILAVIAEIGAAGGTGYALEFSGETVRRMSMEGRMTMCNMTIEAGARFGLIAPDEVTFAYLKGRPLAPPSSLWDAAVADWRTLPSDPDAAWVREVALDASSLEPHVTWGTSPQDALPVGGVVPDPEKQEDPGERARMRRALEYMALSRDADDRHPRGQGVYRLLHQFADRRPAGRRGGGEGTNGGVRGDGAGRAGIGAGEAAGGGGGAGPGLPRRRFPVAARGARCALG